MGLNENFIRETIKNCNTQKELIVKLGFKYNGGTKRTVINACKKFNIDLSNLNKKLTEDKYNLKPKKCKYCGEIIPYNKRENEFCCSSCAASFNNKGRRHTLETKKKLSKKAQEHSKNFNGDYNEYSLKYCKNCGKLLTNGQKHFCSLQCLKDYKYNNYIQQWKEGTIDGLSGEYNLSKHIRKYLIEKHNNKCELCGWCEVNTYTNTIPLEIHHIDGNYKNNTEENLQFLCPNCHALTETYKAHNKNGRKERKKYN